MTRTVRLLPLLFLTFAMPLQAQEPESDDRIQLGGIELTLGMPQEEVLQKLASVYDLNYINPRAGWFVQRRGGPPFDVVGVVGFTDNRLTFANAVWGPNNQTAQDLATTLSDAVRSVAPSVRMCAVSVEPLSGGTETTIRCGRHEIQMLAFTDSNRAVSVNVTLR